MKKIAETVKHPLKGLKLVTYYGCLLSRPPEVTKFDDPENPTLMDQVLEAAARPFSNGRTRPSAAGPATPSPT